MEGNFLPYLLLGILLILGLASTRAVKPAKLPNVTGYLIIGLVAAIICIVVDNLTGNTLGLVESLDQLNEFISPIALGFIALSIGEEFKLSKIKEYGTKIIGITLLQAFAAVFLVDVVLLIVCLATGQSVAIALCLGAIATATAPAATIMVINQYKAKGPLVDLLLPVVAFDDAVGLIVFAISVAISKVIITGAEITIVSLVLIPLLEIVGSLVLGFVLGWLMHILIKFFKSRDNHSINLIAFTILGVASCEALNQISVNGQHLEFSNWLCCMMIGAAYTNLTKNDEEFHLVERDFGLIKHWTPFLFMLFFVLSGTHLVSSATSIFETAQQGNGISLGLVAIIFVCYIVMRSGGKYFGAYIGCKLTKRSPLITKYLGITLLPQAGVAIGMALTIGRIEDFKIGGIGDAIITVVLCATLVYELVGPLLTKWSLNKAGEIPDENGNYPYLSIDDTERK